MNFINEILDYLFIELLPGDALLEIVDKYYTFQPEYKQVLMLLGVGLLSTFGLIGIIKSILKFTSSIIKIVLIGGIIYFITDVVLGISIWSLIFG